MSFNKQVIYFNDKVYIVRKTFKDHPDFPTAEAKDYFNCDTVLKKDGILYICEQIQEAQIIEDESIQLVETPQGKEQTKKKERKEGNPIPTATN
jgi:protein associated with RNAse G/E